MPRYLYNARDGKGETANGVVAAASIEEASQLLRADGKFITKLMEVTEEELTDRAAPPPSTTQRVSRDDVIFFAHQMSVMVETGVPIGEALDCVVQQAVSPAFKAILKDVAEHVQAGGELSVALKKYPNVFPTVMTSLIRASEVSGTMGTMLDRVSRYMAKERRIVKQARGALMYPCFMIFFAITVTVFLLIFVLPRFATIYAARQAALPAPTRLLLFISGGLVSYWYYWLALAVALGIGVYLFCHASIGRRCMDWIKLNVPIARNLFTQLYIARACRTMGTMIAAGVSMLDTVAIAKQVTRNVFYEELWDEVDVALRQGAQLSDPLNKSLLMPRSVVQMIRSGEKSGRLGQILERIAEFAENEFDEAVKRTTQFIEPVMVIFMGGLVGFIAISLLLPIFSVSTVVAGK